MKRNSETFRELNRIRRTRMYVMTSAIFLISGFILMMFKGEFAYMFHSSQIVISGVVMVFVMYGATSLLMLYLRGSLSQRLRDMYSGVTVRDEVDDVSSDFLAVSDLNDLRKQLRELRNEIVTTSSVKQALSEDDKVQMLNALRDQFASRLLKEAEQQQSELMAERLGLIPIRRSFDSASNRLRDELAVLNRRGNLNLVIGTLTTLAAVWLLIYTAMGHNSEFLTFPSLLSYYIPRISTVAFVEIFAFFFLRLYKSGLVEMKYYQNELTTLALAEVAVELAAQEAKEKGFGDLPRILVGCDRNNGTKVAGNEGRNNNEVLEKAANIVQELSKLIPAVPKQ